MKTFKQIFLLCTAFAACAVLSACGYHMGSMMHPQIKTIAIAEIKNDTKEPLLTKTMRQQLAEQVQVDGSLKLVSQEKADCILYCRILKLDTLSVREDSDDGQENYRPSEFQVTVTGDFVVLIPGQSKPLIPKRQITASANYQYESDPQIVRVQGLKQACLRFARLAMQYTTEAW